MTKNLHIIILTIVFMIITSTSARANEDRKRIIVPTFDIPPLLMYSKSGNPEGFGYDLLTEIAAIENWDLEFVKKDMANFHKELYFNHDETINLVTFVSQNPYRERFLDFTTISGLNTCGTLITNKGHTLQRLSDLEGKTVAVLDNAQTTASFKQAIDELGLDCNLIEFPYYREALDYILLHKKAIALVNNHTFTYHFTHNNKYKNLVSTLFIFPSHSLKFAVRKGMDSDILSAINKHLSSWKGVPNSPYTRITEKWSDLTIRPDSQYLNLTFYELLSIPLIGLGLLIWILLLRYKVRVNTEKIKSKELDLEATLMSIGDGVLVTDTEGNILNINPIATKLLGVDKNITGRSTSSLNQFILLDLKTLKTFINPIRDIIENKEHSVKTGKCILKNTSNEEYTITYTASPINLDGALKGVIFVFKDITEEAENTKRIAQSERDLSIIIESVNEAIFVFDKDLTLLQINNYGKEMVGEYYNKEDLVGKNCQNILCDTIIDCSKCPATEALKTKKTSTSIRSNQLGQFFQIKVTPILDNLSEAIGVIASVLDITELKSKEKALKISENNYRALIENQSDIIVKLNSIGEILFVTQSCLDYFGHTESEMVGHICFDFIFSEDHELIRNTIAAFEVNHNVKIIEARHKTPRGLCWVAWQLTGVYDETGELNYVITTGRDITDSKLVSEQLKHVQKLEAIGQLAGGVAHDFNNMLGGIVGYAELIIMQSTENETIKKYSKQIIDTGEKAAELTQQLLSFARKGKTLSTPIDAHSSIKRAIDILKRSIKKNVSIELLLEAKNSMIIGDPTQIQNIILNLGINARDAIGDDEDGCFTIETTTVILSKNYCDKSDFNITPGSYILIKARDTGIGMEQEILEHIFEPFFTTKGIGKGTGLGLASIFGAVTSHGGAITAESEPNSGTEFNVFLPVIADIIERTDEETTTDVLDLKTKKKHHVILIIDDEEIIRTVANSLLNNMGYDVLLAKDGVEGLKIFKANKDIISVIILDVIMPRMGGKEALKNLMQIDPTVKVVVASGFSQSERANDFFELGAQAFIHKPYRQKELMNTLNEILK